MAVALLALTTTSTMADCPPPGFASFDFADNLNGRMAIARFVIAWAPSCSPAKGILSEIGLWLNSERQSFS